MQNIIKNIDAEIHSATKNQAKINVSLIRSGDKYVGHSGKKIEGECIFKSKEASQSVQVSYYEGQIEVYGISSEENNLSGILAKDNTALLEAIKDKCTADMEIPKPAFIVGPPGTGKSTVIKKSIEKGLEHGLRILVVSPTHMAVENIFERVDMEKFGLDDGDVVLKIDTKLETLKAFSPENIAQRKLQPLLDEIDVLESIRSAILKEKRDSEPQFLSLSNKASTNITLIKNLEKDLKVAKSEIKQIQNEIKQIQNRADKISKIPLVASLRKMISSDKADELEAALQAKTKQLASSKKKELIIKQSIKEKQDTKNQIEPKLNKEKSALKELDKGLKDVNERLKRLRAESDNYQRVNVYEKAKLVGTTLVSASMNAQIQSGDFDLIFVDESSMALIPYIYVVAQALNKMPYKAIKYDPCKKLQTNQNHAVSLALKNQLVLVGDPRQLSPIATTYEMKMSIFELYGVDRIFGGEHVENTVFLDVNFRNPPQIVEVVSKLFYGGMLKAGKKSDLDQRCMYIKKSRGYMTRENGSYVNNANASIVVEQVSKALKKGVRSIGIVTPYKQQASLINKMLQGLLEIYADADVQAGTIHLFQGKEKDVVIYDITYSPNGGSRIPITYQGDSKSEAGRLINVATTRAERFFIIVGNIDEIMSLHHDKELVLKKWLGEIIDIF